MAGSVGIGGLIIGVSLLVVFSMAVQTIGNQFESSMDSIEAAAEPLPSFTVDSSDIWLFALEDITITSGGTDYVNGTLVASSCTGFSARWPEMRIMSCHEVDRNIVQSSSTNVKLDWTRLFSTLYTLIYIAFAYVQKL